MPSQTTRRPGLLISLVPVGFLVFLLVVNVIIFKDDATGGANQLALLAAGLFVMALGRYHLKVPYEQMEEQVVASIGLALKASLILLTVGALIGTWILSGVVPTMIYYGLELINPTFFLPIACVTCSVVSLATGSSWSTTGTVGIALIGIGQTLNIPEGMVAGAIISGAYFGDKMSPLSDTTNLAPAMAGTDLFTHIRHMVYTSGPAIFLAILGFFGLGLFYQTGAVEQAEIQKTLVLMRQNFHLGWYLFIPAFLVLLMVAKKVPAFPALCVGVLLGALFAIFFQAELLIRMNNGVWSLKGVYSQIVHVAHSGFSIETGNKLIDSLFNRGGMSSMLSTVWLILMAMVFGGALEATGMLGRIAESILKLVSGTGSLVGSTLASCLFLNATASDQYLAIVVPGRMFRKAYEDYGLHPKNLSRALEDAGTVTSVLIPWNSGGAYNSGVLGVATVTYMPYCFFNLLSPLISLFLASMNWTIEREVVEKKVKLATA